MVAGGLNKLPYGNLPRLLLAWVCSEAVRTQSRDLVLGRSLYEFMHKLGLEDRSGSPRGDRARLKNQMRRLFTCSVQLVYAEGDHEVVVSSYIADRAEFWWSVTRPDAPALWDSTIQLGEKFFKEIIARPVPLDLNTLKALKRSPLGLDLYFWLVYRTYTIKAPLTLSWRQLYRTVRRTPGERAGGHQRVPPAMSARAKENQTGMAGPELSHRHGRAGHRALAASYLTVTAPSHQRVGAPLVYLVVGPVGTGWLITAGP